MSFSIIMPMDMDRLEQFERTKEAYDGMKQVKEFIILTRYLDKLHRHLESADLMKNVRLIPYKIESGFNCSKALNLGVRKAHYENVIITSPEVIPKTNVLQQLSEHLDKNIICAVDDQAEDGTLSPLVNTQFRGDTPAMYFLAMFKKSDIEKINGWDEDFMNGYAYEDNDFGDRWMRAKLPFVIRDDIKALHQYHPRVETVPGGMNINFQLWQQNNANGVIQCRNGLRVLN